jgi:hypothetical protein
MQHSGTGAERIEIFPRRFVWYEGQKRVGNVRSAKQTRHIHSVIASRFQIRER